MTVPLLKKKLICEPVSVLAAEAANRPSQRMQDYTRQQAAGQGNFFREDTLKRSKINNTNFYFDEDVLPRAVNINSSRNFAGRFSAVWRMIHLVSSCWPVPKRFLSQ